MLTNVNSQINPQIGQTLNKLLGKVFWYQKKRNCTLYNISKSSAWTFGQKTFSR